MAAMIASRYSMEAEIGAGGMGTVYRGTDNQTRQPVAIKHLKPELARPDLIERFQREGEALRDLNHPNIVKLLDTVQENGSYYLVMEYVSGGDLTGLLNTGRLDTGQILRLAIDLADALTRAHKLNIIHRDLKPGNVLIGEDGMLRLTDFGVAHVGGKQRVTEVDTIVGTLDYLAPEVLNGEPPDAQADIWAFGVMLFEMVAGMRPFAGESLTEILTQIATAPVPDLEKLRPSAPAALIDLIYRMLERDKHARIASVRIVGAELEAILQGRSTDRLVVREHRFATPAPDELKRPMHNLPAQTTAFIGRESELLELSRLLKDPNMRLITILAPGGMGKTRLSLELAERQLEHFDSGVYFVQLAPLSDPAGIIPAMAEATGYPFQQDGRDQKQQVFDYLSPKNMLLVLDNYEHLMAGAGLVTEILQAARQVRIIVTSRQRLNQSGETVFNLEAMDFPEWETPADALEYAAVKLFMQSAKRVQPDFELAANNLQYVARICRLARGMPLGILLAAGWLSTLPPAEIADEMQKNLDFLESDMGDLPERHRSLRAVFEYSWKLMTEPEQQAFMKLSVFRGGFTREAAQAVAGTNIRTLMTLINKSLLHRDVDSGRYDVHELLRQYAEEKLQQSGEAETIRELHSRYYLEFLRQREADIKGRNQFAGLNEIEVDFENVQTAWYRAVNQKNAGLVSQSLEALYWFCSFRSRYLIGGEMLQRARAQWPQEAEDRASLLAARLQVYFAPEKDRTRRLEWALAVARRHESQAEIALCLQQLGKQLSHLELNSEGLTLLEESLKLYEASGDSFHAAETLDDLGWGYNLAGQNELRVQVVRCSIDLREAIGDRIGKANSLRNLATSTWYSDIETTIRLLSEAREIGIEMREPTGTAWSALLLAAQMMFTGNLDRTLAFIQQGRELAEDMNVAVLKGLAYLMHGWLRGLQGDAHQGMQLTEQGLAFAGGNPDPALAFFAFYALLTNAIMLGKMDIVEARLRFMLSLIETIMGGQKELPAIFARQMMLAMPYYAGLLAQDGQPERAVERLSMALTHPTWVGGWAEKWNWLHDLQARLKQTLGEAAYQAAWERGTHLVLEQVVQEMRDRVDL